MERANSRLEAFSDGVFAIAITLLVMDIRLPGAERLASTAEVWRALLHLTPAVMAFLLSFAVILISWMNHHAVVDVVRRSSASFVYANGFLLLTVVFIPFPTALLGQLIGTPGAAPAVVLYDGVLAVQALAWVLMAGSVLRQRLTDDEAATAMIRRGFVNGQLGFALYALLAIAAFWMPVAAAITTAASWIFWLVLGVSMKSVAGRARASLMAGR